MSKKDMKKNRQNKQKNVEIKKSISVNDFKRFLDKKAQEFDMFFNKLDKKNRTYMFIMPIALFLVFAYYLIFPDIFKQYQTKSKKLSEAKSAVYKSEKELKEAKKEFKQLTDEYTSLKDKFFLYKNQSIYLFNLINSTIDPMKLLKNDIIMFNYGLLNNASEHKIKIKNMVITNNVSYDRYNIEDFLSKPEKQKAYREVDGTLLSFVYKANKPFTSKKEKSKEDNKKKDNGKMVKKIKIYYIDVTGNYKNLLKFLYKLENTKKFIFITDLYLQPNRSQLVINLEGLNNKFVKELYQEEKKVFKSIKLDEKKGDKK